MNPTPPAAAGQDVTGQRLTVKLGTSKVDESCDACFRYWNGTRTANHTVLAITVGDMGFSLCPACANDLITQLQRHEPCKKRKTL